MPVTNRISGANLQGILDALCCAEEIEIGPYMDPDEIVFQTEATPSSLVRSLAGEVPGPWTWAHASDVVPGEDCGIWSCAAGEVTPLDMGADAIGSPKTARAFALHVLGHSREDIEAMLHAAIGQE